MNIDVEFLMPYTMGSKTISLQWQEVDFAKVEQKVVGNLLSEEEAAQLDDEIPF